MSTAKNLARGEGKRVVIAGGSGFVGSAIRQMLEALGYSVVVLTRKGSGQNVWDGKTVGAWHTLLNGAEAVINLSGESVAQKWTMETLKKIVDSRVDATRAIGQAIQKCANPPKIWINASAVGYFGDGGDERLTEASTPGPTEDFLVECCVKWEAAQAEFVTPNTVQSRVRIGFVMGLGGGGFPVLLKLTKAFLGGSVGSGKQFMPWIHVADLAALFTWLVETKKEGVFMGSAPHPVRNSEFMAAMRKSLGRPPVPPAPGFALQLASAFGAPDPAVVLNGQNAVPERTLAEGFEFAFSDVQDAIADLVGGSR